MRRMLAGLGAVALAGCAQRPLTEPVPLTGGTRAAVAIALVAAPLLLSFHLWRWMLGRWPTCHDAMELFLAATAVFAMVASGLTVLSHRQADELFSTPVGDEPEVVGRAAREPQLPERRRALRVRGEHR